MSVEEVRQQVEYVALVTKQASSVSDLRRFNWLAPSIKARTGGQGREKHEQGSVRAAALWL